MKRVPLTKDATMSILRGSEAQPTPAGDGASTSAPQRDSTPRKATPRRTTNVLKALYLAPDDVSLLEDEVLRRKKAARKAGEEVRGIDVSALVRDAIQATYGKRRA